MTSKVSCTLAEEWIYLSLDGELSPELVHQLERHLDGCRACQERYDRALAEQKLLSAEMHSLSGQMEHLLEGGLDRRDLSRIDLGEERVPFWRQLRAPAGIAACLVVAASATLLVWLATRGAGVELARLEWDARGLTLRHGDGALEQLAGTGARLFRTGEMARIDSGTQATLAFEERGIDVEIDGAAHFGVRLEGGIPRLVLEKGAATCTVAPGMGGFWVETPAAFAKVAGTRFCVHHDADRGQTLVEVLEGEVSVELRARVTRVTLRAGESACAYRADIQDRGWRRNDATDEWEPRSLPRARWILMKVPRAVEAEPEEVEAAGAPSEPAVPEPLRVAPVETPERTGVERPRGPHAPLDLPPSRIDRSNRFEDPEEGPEEDPEEDGEKN